MTELDRIKILSALKKGFNEATGKNTTEKEFENFEYCIDLVKKLTIPNVLKSLKDKNADKLNLINGRDREAMSADWRRENL